jgi:hypothetical protein
MCSCVCCFVVSSVTAVGGREFVAQRESVAHYRASDNVRVCSNKYYFEVRPTDTRKEGRRSLKRATARRRIWLQTCSKFTIVCFYHCHYESLHCENFAALDSKEVTGEKNEMVEQLEK